VKRWQLWLGIVISILFMWRVVDGLELNAVWDVVEGAEYWWLLPGVGAYFIGVWARAWRWHYLLRPLKSIPTRRMFPIVAIGYMGNNIYPARAGELLRAYVLRRNEGIPVSASLATIIIERAFDGLVMLGFVFLTLPQLTMLTSASGFIGNIRQLAVIGAVVFLAAVGLFILMAVFPEPAQKMIGWTGDRLVPKKFRQTYDSITEKFLGGLASLRSPKDVMMVLVTSIVSCAV